MGSRGSSGLRSDPRGRDKLAHSRLVRCQNFVIVPERISAGERVRIRIRVPEPPFVRLPVPVLGLPHIRVPDTDADHIGTGLAEHARVFSTCIVGTACIAGACNFGTDRIHAGEHRRAGEHSTGGVRFHVAAADEKGLQLVRGRSASSTARSRTA